MLLPAAFPFLRPDVRAQPAHLVVLLRSLLVLVESARLVSRWGRRLGWGWLNDCLLHLIAVGLHAGRLIRVRLVLRCGKGRLLGLLQHEEHLLHHQQLLLQSLGVSRDGREELLGLLHVADLVLELADLLLQSVLVRSAGGDLELVVLEMGRLDVQLVAGAP